MTKNDYVRTIVDLYRQTPGTTGTIRRSDRHLAATLYDRGIPVTAVEHALLLAASRRLFRPPDAAPLQPIRSLHYLLPVLEEVLTLRVSPDFFRYLRSRIQALNPRNP